jgi:hypothetical protein
MVAGAAFNSNPSARCCAEDLTNVAVTADILARGTNTDGVAGGGDATAWHPLQWRRVKTIFFGSETPGPLLTHTEKFAIDHDVIANTRNACAL